MPSSLQDKMTTDLDPEPLNFSQPGGSSCSNLLRCFYLLDIRACPVYQSEFSSKTELVGDYLALCLSIIYLSPISF